MRVRVRVRDATFRLKNLVGGLPPPRLVAAVRVLLADDERAPPRHQVGIGGASRCDDVAVQNEIERGIDESRHADLR